MTDLVRLEVDEGIATIRVDRPPMNALNAEIQRGLVAVCREAAERRDVAAVVVCSVARTRCPVSAVSSAIDTVSRSLISPMRTTSGSSRSAYLRADAKLLVSAPTSRWLMMQLRCR